MDDSKRKELTVFQAASPLNAMGILFSAVVYCARTAISSALSAMSKLRTSSIRPACCPYPQGNG